MTIHESIKAGIPNALRSKDLTRLTTLRSLLTAMTNEVIAKKRKPEEVLTDNEALVVLKRAANQRKDSIEQYEKGNRQELAKDEKEELTIIRSFLPPQLSRAEIRKVATEKISELGSSSEVEIGRLIGALMKEFNGKADGTDVKAVVEELLS